MLKLRASAASPFVRKVIVASHFTGHFHEIEVLPADTMNPEDPLRQDNPLGKIPCLILNDGESLYDSRVIVEYLDHLAGGGKVIPTTWPERMAALKLQALTDGITDAAVLQIYEGRFRKPERHEPAWMAHQAGKVERGLAALEVNPPIATENPNIGVISLACFLDWYGFRFTPIDEENYPRLASFIHDFKRKVPFFADSAPR